MEKLEDKYGDMPWRWVTADNFTMARAAMFELLDEGIDTLILAAPRPIYSHHEEFNGSIKHAMHYVHEWQEQNGHKEIKMIISPELSHFEPMYETHPTIIRDNLDTHPGRLVGQTGVVRARHALGQCTARGMDKARAALRRSGHGGGAQGYC